MRGRRRRARSTWFPVLGTTYNNGDQSWSPVWERARVQAYADATTPPGGQCIETFPIIPDQTPQISSHDAEFTLRDYVEGQDWMLDSIVGTILVGCGAGDNTATEQQAWQVVLGTVGFFVADTEEEDPSSPDAHIFDYAPQGVDNARSPWIWRRTWQLLNPGWTGASLAFNGQWPTTNAVYTGNNGCGIRTKTRRRIRRNQRLFMVSQVTGWAPDSLQVSGTDDQQPFLNVTADIRICGKMMRQRNQSSF